MTFISAKRSHGSSSLTLTTPCLDRNAIHPQSAFAISDTSLGVSPHNMLIASSESLAAPARSFEPILPDTSALLGFGVVVAISIVAAIVWNTQVVPVSRTKLALSKKSGDVKEYLDGLKETEDSDRKFEQWLFTDWLQTSRTKKDPALPILPKAKWNSGDNPVLAATALIIVGVVISSIVEKLAASS